MLETSLGELVIDLEVDRCPKTCENFLKLCKIKYYALNAFFNGQSCAPPDTRDTAHNMAHSFEGFHRSNRRSDCDGHRRRIARLLPSLSEPRILLEAS